MKTLKISDHLHAELTAVVGQLIAKSGEIKTYGDAVEALLHQSVILPPEVLQDIEAFITKNKQFSYSTKEEFLREAARWLIDDLSRVHKNPVMPQSDNGARNAICQQAQIRNG